MTHGNNKGTEGRGLRGRLKKQSLQRVVRWEWMGDALKEYECRGEL